MRGRKPNPSNVVALRGNPGKRRRNTQEPRPAPGTPARPRWLKGGARRAWDMIVPQLEAMGVVTLADEAALALLCQVYADWQEQGTATLGRLAQGLLAEFGLTPSARSRLKVPEAPKRGGYADFRKGGR